MMISPLANVIELHDNCECRSTVSLAFAEPITWRNVPAEPSSAQLDTGRMVAAAGFVPRENPSASERLVLSGSERSRRQSISMADPRDAGDEAVARHLTWNAGLGRFTTLGSAKGQAERGAWATNSTTEHREPGQVAQFRGKTLYVCPLTVVLGLLLRGRRSDFLRLQQETMDLVEVQHHG